MASASATGGATGRFRPSWDLVGFLFLTLVVGGLGALLTLDPLQSWYPGLAKPSWTPPNWLFGPVWTLLYLLMGFAAWRVWRATEADARAVPLGLFGVQLALNLAWSGLFFAARNPFWGLAGIALLWIAIVATLWAFHRVDRLAGWAMVPYLAWVTFAAALNYAIWALNG